MRLAGNIVLFQSFEHLLMLSCSVKFWILDEVVLMSLPPHTSCIDHAVMLIVDQ
jgi:hypothetical protein